MPRRNRRITRRSLRRLKNKIAKKQYGSGFSFGVDLPQIAGQPEVVNYSDCGSVAVPQPMDQSQGNLVGGQTVSAPNVSNNIPTNQTIQTALNAPGNSQVAYTADLQVGGKRRRRTRKSRITRKTRKSKGRKVRKSRGRKVRSVRKSRGRRPLSRKSRR